ncbi:MAG: hypothetical protein CMB56_001605 [Methanobacteriota archaeon]|nr:MAG: hypothetical protein CMB56_001605 [Euryarchaeota archaeon]
MASNRLSISTLKIPNSAIRFFMDSWKISELYPPQKEALTPILEGDNTLISIPTASGKSLVAYIGIIHKLLINKKGSKAVYIVPLKALAGEKYTELSQLAKATNLNVGLSLGDREGENTNIENADIIVCTSEKFDSLMRNRPHIMEGLSVIIADEVHLINDSSRGPTMEINLTRFLNSNSAVQIIALSATIGNSETLAKWLKAKLIVSSWRPVTLEQSTLANVDLEPRKRISSSKQEISRLPPPRTLEGPASRPMIAALEDSLNKDIQSLIFVSTRRSAQSLARKLSERITKIFLKKGNKRLSKFQSLKKGLKNISDDSSISDNLQNVISGGVAFHHAGLSSNQRKYIEDAFREKKIMCIVATPTLASGVNLPARRVIIRDLKRFELGMSRWLSVMEVQQMLGRAGRPRYDSLGEAWLHCKGERALENADSISEKYIHGTPEEISSKLAAENSLRTHILSLIATNEINSRYAISNFFKNTFLGHTQPHKILEERIEQWVLWLTENEFIKRLGCDNNIYEYLDKTKNLESSESWNDEVPSWVNFAKDSEGIQIEKKSEIKSRPPTNLGFNLASDWEDEIISPNVSEPITMTYEASSFGKLITRMYLDPTSGLLLRDGLRRAVRRYYKNSRDLPLTIESLLYLIVSTDDFLNFWWKDSEYEKLNEKSTLIEMELLNEISLQDIHLSRIKSVCIFMDWIEEFELRDIEKIHKVMPGDLRGRIELAEWLLFSSKQILLNDDKFNEIEEHKIAKKNVINMIEELTKRITYGCKKELLGLISIQNIGRKRARDLVNMGIQKPHEIRKLTDRDKSRLLALPGWGPKLLEKILIRINNKNTNFPRTKMRPDDEPLPHEK